ncbi:MAG: NrsF family protein [Defluviimonas denitrificans]
MKTEDLISQLAGEPVAAQGGVERRAVTGLGIGFLIALALFLPVLGPRPDLMEAVQRPIVAVKTILPLLLAPVALLLALRAARPTTPAPAGVKALWLWPAWPCAVRLCFCHHGTRRARRGLPWPFDPDLPARHRVLAAPILIAVFAR